MASECQWEQGSAVVYMNVCPAALGGGGGRGEMVLWFVSVCGQTCIRGCKHVTRYVVSTPCLAFV